MTQEPEALPNESRPYAGWVLPGALCVGVFCLSLTGCSQETHSPIEQYEHLPTTEQLDTVSLGQYVICIPLPSSDDRKCDQMQLEFELYAAVLPRYTSHVKVEMDRLEGRLRDAVIQACRHTPVDDLVAPLMTTFKSHLEETIRPYFANASIERVHIADIQIRQL